MSKGMIPALLLSAVGTVAGLKLPATTLNGDSRSFPHDAEGPRSIFVVTFSKAATAEASAWTRKLRDNRDKLSAAIFQVAVLEDVPRIFRSVVVSAMAREVPAPLHDHFWIAVTASGDWQRCVDSTALDEPHVFALDGRDHIVWRAHGSVSDAKLRELLELPAPQGPNGAPAKIHPAG